MKELFTCRRQKTKNQTESFSFKPVGNQPRFAANLTGAGQLQNSF